MVLARLAQSARHGRDLLVSLQCSIFPLPLGRYEYDAKLGVYCVRPVPFGVGYAALLCDFRYLGLLFSKKSECLTIRSGAIGTTHDSFRLGRFISYVARGRLLSRNIFR